MMKRLSAGDTLKYKYFRREINTAEQCIEYNNTNQILLQIGDWYIMKENDPNELHNSYVYHRFCPSSIDYVPFLHYLHLRCQGCGQSPPDGIAGLYALHNMEPKQC